MDAPEGTQGLLFASPLVGFVANVRWQTGEGWRLWVSSWDEGETPARARTDVYERLTADELLDVLAAVQLERCEWLRV